MNAGGDARVGIWVEASERIGFGHLVRMLVLARQLRRGGAKVTFLTPRGSLALRPIQKEQFAARSLPRRGRGQQTHAALSLLQHDHLTHVVIDLPEALSMKAAQLLRRANAALILIDDLGNARKRVDLTINAIDHIPYARGAKGHGRVLEGARYMILREELARANPAPVQPVARHVVLSFGGSDPANLTDWTLRALRCLPPSTRITSLLGTGYRFEKNLRKEAARSPLSVQIVRSLPRPWVLFRSADLVMTHFGLTVYELARLGVPTVLIHPTAYHDGVARVFARRNSVVNLGFFKNLHAETVCTKTLALLRNWRKRRAVVASGRSIVDGRGVERVARLILQTQRTS